MSTAATLQSAALDYVNRGFGITWLDYGTKAPKHKDWNTPNKVVTTSDKARTIWREPHNIGVVHSLGTTKTCSFDADRVDDARAVLAEFGIDLDALRQGVPTIQGKPGNFRLLYRQPEGVDLNLVKLEWPDPNKPKSRVTVFELRAGPCQDVLPPSRHPSGVDYQWLVPPGNVLPEPPPALLELWRNWETWVSELQATCPWAKPAEPKVTPHRKADGANLDVIGQFNNAHDVRAILEANGYRPKGGCRYLPPNSTSGVPSVRILDSGRVYSSNGSCPLNDGHAHDAFSIFSILEHDGDVRAAVRAAAAALGVELKRKPSEPGARPSAEPGAANIQADPLVLPTVSRCTHLANSYRIRHYYKGRLWYALGLGWVMWTGKFWRSDPTSEGSIATGFVDNLSRLIARESAALSRSASEESDEDRRTALMEQAESLLKWAVQSENERTIAAGLKLTKHALLIEYGALNADPWLFNVQNGTVDLRTGMLRPHDPDNLITFISPVTYNSVATCPNWERFLLEVFAGDAEMVAFIQRAVGWSLTGVVKERALFFLYGHAGKNGKTTMVEAIMKLVGNYGESCYGYGRKVGAETFMKSRNMEDNQRKAATLAGPRFICTSEVDEEHRLNEQLIKDITGGDTIEGRRLYQEAFTFKPQFKPWMYGNHKPEIRGTDDAIWSRVRLVPFEVSFKGREDLELGEKLEAELSGILNWAIQGCLDWQRHGLNPPEKVQAATREYREEMDVFGPFIRECCVIHREAEVRANNLWSAYKAWCADNSQREQNQTKFGKYLTAKGFTVERSNGIKRMGIGLLDTLHSDSGTVGTVGTVKPESPYEKPSKGGFLPNPSNCSNPSADRNDREVF